MVLSPKALIQEKWNLIDSPENYRYSSASFHLENKKSWSF
jgi:hypothetical protein